MSERFQCYDQRHFGTSYIYKLFLFMSCFLWLCRLDYECIQLFPHSCHLNQYFLQYLLSILFLFLPMSCKWSSKQLSEQWLLQLELRNKWKFEECWSGGGFLSGMRMSSHCECGIIHLEQMSMYALVGDDLQLQCGVMA